MGPETENDGEGMNEGARTPASSGAPHSAGSSVVPTGEPSQGAARPAPEWLVELLPHTGQPDECAYRLRRLDAVEIPVGERFGGQVTLEFLHRTITGSVETVRARLFLPPELRESPSLRLHVPPVNFSYNAAYFFHNAEEARRPVNGSDQLAMPVLSVVIQIGEAARMSLGDDTEADSWAMSSPLAHLETTTAPIQAVWSSADMLVPINPWCQRPRPHSPTTDRSLCCFVLPGRRESAFRRLTCQRVAATRREWGPADTGPQLHT